MKFSSSVALTLASAGSLAAAHGGHGHARFHKRGGEAAPTVYDFVVVDPQQSGKPERISNKDACSGLAQHELEWLGIPIPAACPTSSAKSSSTPTPTPSSTSTPTPQVLEQTAAAISTSSSSSTPSTSSVTVTPTSSSTAAPAPASTSKASASASSGSSGSSATGLDKDFPDGELDCGTFPSDYGAISLNYLGLGGWSGIQYVSIVDQVISDIVTAVTGQSCSGGAMCSYACPPGYQKSQWPSTQGKTGQSVGGLQCKGGKLYLTNKDLSNKLCIEGKGGVHVRNDMSNHVAVCRTDYPGTESETIPLHAAAGQTNPLTSPDGETYFKWQGKTTSAQYYVNNKGISTEKGCQWGDGSEPIGNWAPMNLGSGYNAGSYWLSMFKNEPTTSANLDFKITIEGEGLTDNCTYDGNGNFYNNKGLIKNGNGCTVSDLTKSVLMVFVLLTRFLSTDQLQHRHCSLRLLRVSAFRPLGFPPGLTVLDELFSPPDLHSGCGCRGFPRTLIGDVSVNIMVCCLMGCFLLCILLFIRFRREHFGGNMNLSLFFLFSRTSLRRAETSRGFVWLDLLQYLKFKPSSLSLMSLHMFY